MKFGNILIVSIKNILHKKRAYFKIIIGFFLVFLISFTIIFYSDSLSTAYTSFENSNADSAMIRALYSFSNEQLSEIISDNRVKSVRYGSSKNLNNDEDINITLGNFEYKIPVEGNREISVFYVNQSGTVVPENAELAFKEKTSSNPIKFGRNIQNKGEVIVSEFLLELIDILPELAIGENIEITSGEYKLNAVVCGVLDARFMYTYNWYYTDVVGYQQSDMENNVFEFSLKKFVGNDGLIENIENMIPENEGVSFWYGTYIMGKMRIVEAQETLCSRFLNLISIMIFLVMCVYVACNQVYLMRKNVVFYGILKANGVSNKNIFIIHFLELFLLCLFSLVLSILASIGIFFALKYMMANVYSINILFSYLTLVWSIPVFLFVGAILSCLLTLYIYFYILKKPPIYLLKAEL